MAKISLRNNTISSVKSASHLLAYPQAKKKTFCVRPIQDDVLGLHRLVESEKEKGAWVVMT